MTGNTQQMAFTSEKLHGLYEVELLKSRDVENRAKAGRLEKILTSEKIIVPCAGKA